MTNGPENMIRRAVQGAGARIPINLYVFVAATFLSNGVNLFNMVYGGDQRPSRSFTILLSCAASVGAAAFWTILASKVDLIEKTVASASRDSKQRESVREELWNDVWPRVGAYLVTALVLSSVALAVLVVPTQG
jgi:hypothetical protein